MQGSTKVGRVGYSGDSPLSWLQPYWRPAYLKMKVVAQNARGEAVRPHELFSGCGVRPSCCIRIRGFETGQNEEILTFPVWCTK